MSRRELSVSCVIEALTLERCTTILPFYQWTRQLHFREQLNRFACQQPTRDYTAARGEPLLDGEA